MSSVTLGAISLGLVLVLIAFRMPIGVALGAISFFFIALVRGLDVAVGMLKSVPFEFAAHWSLSAIPMFLLMGAIVHASGISVELFRAARLWLSNLPGGLAIATNFASAGFAAASGSSVATAATMGKIAIPEMLKSGYDAKLATGVVASAGTLGALIPPSILFVLFGIFAEVSITKLLIAGLLPGLLTAFLYGLSIFLRCWINPEVGPASHVSEPLKVKIAALGAVLPLLIIIFCVIGGLYSGLTTPTEAGAFGSLMTLVVVAFRRRLSWLVVKESVSDAVITTARIFFVAIGAVLLTKWLAISGLIGYVGSEFGYLSSNPLLLFLFAALLFVLLGMFLDPLGIMLLTLPFLIPLTKEFSIDLIWFGVFVVKFLEIGMLTPPVGFNVYVIKSVVGDSIGLETIFKGVLWFLFCDMIVVAALILFPEIATLLPNMMN